MRWGGVRILMCLLVLAACGEESGDTIAALADRARAEAKRWQADAVLIAIEASAGEDGRLDKADPAHQAVFHFTSRSSGQGLAVVAQSGKLEQQPRVPGKRDLLPVADKFVELSEAVREARRHDLRGPMIRAELRAHRTALDKPDRTLWLVMASGGSGPGAAPVYVDAGTGKVARIVALQPPPLSTNARAKLPDTTAQFPSLRKAADAAARESNAGFRLYGVALNMCRDEHPIQHAARPKDFKPAFAEALFYYMRDVGPLGWEDLKIALSGGVHATACSKRQDVASMTVGPVRKPETFWVPERLPDRLYDPEKALKRLEDAYPLFQSRPVFRDAAGITAVWLMRKGDPYRSLYRGPTPEEHAVFTEKAAGGKWYWWTVVNNTRRRPDAPQERWRHFVLVDAVSGAETSHCTGAEPVVAGREKKLVPMACPPPD